MSSSEASSAPAGAREVFEVASFLSSLGCRDDRLRRHSYIDDSSLGCYDEAEIYCQKRGNNMIFVAGAGAMAEAAKAMRRIQRSLDRRAALSKRRARARGLQFSGDYEPKRVEFECKYLCAACGYFVDTAPADDSNQACPACANDEWLDLAVEPLADRLRDMEAEERMEPPKFIRRLVVGVPLVIFAAILIGIVTTSYLESGQFWSRVSFANGSHESRAYVDYSLLTIVAAIFVVPLAYYFLPRPLAVLLLRGQERTPHRWHVPLSLPNPERKASRTLQDIEAQQCGEVLTAPISGRECLAYQVCVLFDVAGDARPPEWVLQEQRSVAIGFGDELEVASGSLYFESPVERVDVSDAEVKRFLRQRGLFITEGEFQFYEARLEPGDRVNVADYDAEMYIIRHTSTPESSGRGVHFHDSLRLRKEAG